MQRRGSAIWRGSIKSGGGTVSSESGVLKDVKYTFGMRFESEPGTNPEELVAAAHAACFSMALSGILGEAGLTPEQIRTTATVTIEKVESGFSVTKVHLDVTAKVPGATKEAFDDAAGKAKAGCPISKLLKAEITMSAVLEA
jgi:osmotically inducible protein OsmC